jgi:hypothetical protein
VSCALNAAWSSHSAAASELSGDALFGSANDAQQLEEGVREEWMRTTEEGLQREEDGLHRVDCRPLVLYKSSALGLVRANSAEMDLEDVQADRAGREVDVRVVAR